MALLEYATKNPTASVTAQTHMSSHNVVYETARQDLIGLEDQGLLVKRRVGRLFVWSPASDLEARLHALT